MMMGAHPRRRYPENSVNVPNPQPHPQQNHEVHPPPRYTPGEMTSPPCYDELYPPGQTLFCFWCGHPHAIQKYYPLPPYSPELPLIQSQETLMSMAHTPPKNMIMIQIGINKITPIPHTQHPIIEINIPSEKKSLLN